MRQVYGEEFRREAVRLAQTSGLTNERVATDLGIGRSTLSAWIKEARGQVDVKASSAPVDFDLLKENERLRQENRILKV